MIYLICSMMLKIKLPEKVDYVSTKVKEKAEKHVFDRVRFLYLLNFNFILK